MKLVSKERHVVRSRSSVDPIDHPERPSAVGKQLTSVPTWRDAPCAETKIANQHLILCAISLSFYM